MEFAFSPFLVPITLFLVIGAVVIAKSPIGEAIAGRIRGRVDGNGELRLEIEQLRQDLDAVRQELAETQERLDFTERLLAKGSAVKSLDRG